MVLRARHFLYAASLGIAALLGIAGCALRATTDFGPQSPSATRSLSVGPEGLPGGVSGVSGPNGDAVGLRGNEAAGSTGSDAQAPGGGR